MQRTSQRQECCCATLFFAEMKKWTRGQAIAVWGVGLPALAAIASWVVVSQFRHATPAGSASEATGLERGRVVGVFAGSVEELRARNHVTLIPVSASEKTLAEIPAGSYGFVFAPYLAHSAPKALQLYTRNNPAYFEVHKLTGSQAEFVGYVGSETHDRLRKGLGKGEKLTLYSSPLEKAPNLTAISLGSVKCLRSRDIAVRRKGATIVLFAVDCKAI
jgi:hypothetical protein